MSAFQHDDILDLRTLADEMRDSIEKIGVNADATHDLGEWMSVARAILSEVPEVVTEMSVGELADLLESQGDNYEPTLIADGYFVEYTKDLIADCYEGAFIKTFTTYTGHTINVSDQWPYRHITIDYASAADELKSDYTSVTILGRDYWMRSV